MTTDELTNRLKAYDNIDEFMRYNKDEFDEDAFGLFIEDILKSKNLNKSEIADKSGISVPYIYGLFNGNKKRPRKDILIRLAYGLELSLDGTNRLLKLGGVSELRPKIRRESIIMFCIDRGKGIDKTDDLLAEYNEPTLINEDRG